MSLFTDYWGDDGDAGGGFAADALGGGFAIVEGMDSLFDRDDVTLEEVLSDPNIIEEVAARSEKLLAFLLSDSELERLLTFVEQLPDEEATAEVRVKYPYLSCEVICVGDPRLLDRVCEAKHLEMLFRILDYKPEQVRSNPQGEQNLAYFEKILDVLLQQRTPRVLRFLRTAGLTVLDKLIRHLYSKSMLALLAQLLMPGASLKRFQAEAKASAEDNPYPLWMDWTEKNAAQIVGSLLSVVRYNDDIDAVLNAGELLAELITADLGEHGNPIAEKAVEEVNLTQMRQLVQYPASDDGKLLKGRLAAACGILTAVAQLTCSIKGPGRVCVDLCLAAQAAAVALEEHIDKSTRIAAVGTRLGRLLGSVFEAVSSSTLSDRECKECNETLRTANGIKVLMEASKKFPDADLLHAETLRASSSALESTNFSIVARQLILDPAPEGPQLLKFVMECYRGDDKRLRALAITLGQSVASCSAADKVADPTDGHEFGLVTIRPGDRVSSLISESQDAGEWNAFSTTELTRATALMCHDLGGRAVPIREDGTPPADAADDAKLDSSVGLQDTLATSVVTSPPDSTASAAPSPSASVDVAAAIPESSGFRGDDPVDSADSPQMAQDTGASSGFADFDGFGDAAFESEISVSDAFGTSTTSEGDNSVTPESSWQAAFDAPNPAEPAEPAAPAAPGESGEKASSVTSDSSWVEVKEGDAAVVGTEAKVAGNGGDLATDVALELVEEAELDGMDKDNTASAQPPATENRVEDARRSSAFGAFAFPDNTAGAAPPPDPFEANFDATPLGKDDFESASSSGFNAGFDAFDGTQ
uniref:Uncharacterized protein n=1 Tax=Pinguiococcus pyrenoidosus TaxID=172671 RepID=A0A7R9Y8M6_9STRA|mmetsp:Transcript_10602/g.39948  ORF Transcript_10602/g.39948 Transcript_10602/m.39948 type:complete len:818 (+) Transcript_10602:63-2516(+)|eukprot:scaffold620_cov282-Pinguiococcus_pyrenoidosus.AAC.1